MRKKCGGVFCAAWRVCVRGTVTPVRVCVLCGMFVHAVLRSCPGPALVSTASVSAVAVVAGGQYARGLDCSVTVYSPGGMAVGLTFSAFYIEDIFDCTWSGGGGGAVRRRCYFSSLLEFAGL
jgi:hypothetical protein